MMHIFYNYLMNFYENERIVKRQKMELEETFGRDVRRDEFMRFICCD